jgi:4-diphosphocytidyl-2-C-methyl-D-erythritol kinase
MPRIEVMANAKINLTLDVIQRLPSGYHQVDMLMQSIDLADRLTFETAESLSLQVPGCPALEADNLILKAAETLRQAAGRRLGARVLLEKRIPLQAGLGGGSADAAAALIALNRLWGLDLPTASLIKIGATIGADVPFCLLGGSMRATGIGTELVRVDMPFRPYVAVIYPCQGVPTKSVYEGLDLRCAPVHRPNHQAAYAALAAGDYAAFARSLGNRLQDVTERMRPPIREACRALERLGADAALMSGSGVSVYGLFSDLAKAERAEKELSTQGMQTSLTRFVSDGVQIVENTEH